MRCSHRRPTLRSTRPAPKAAQAGYLERWHNIEGTEIILETLFISLGTGIVCALLGAWVGFRLGRGAKAQDDREELIRDVAEKYRKFYYQNKKEGVDGLIKSGVERLITHNEVEKAIQLIQAFGLNDPFNTIREQLTGKDPRDLFRAIREGEFNPLHPDGLKMAIEKTGLMKK
jgi:hypothetical protein